MQKTLRQPPINALAAQGSAQPVPPRASRAPATVGGVVRVGADEEGDDGDGGREVLHPAKASRAAVQAAKARL